MPVDPRVAAKRHLVEQVASAAEIYATAEGRDLMHEFGSGGTRFDPPAVAVEERTLDAGHGPYTVRIYRPDPEQATGAAFVWNHGGAFIGGDLDMPEADHVARVLCVEGVLVVTVDYHLCRGGTHFPVPHDDVVAARRWTRDSIDELGIDPGRVSLGGASAGGTLAAGAALRLRDDDDVPGVDRLVLIYPVLHSPLPEASADLRERLTELPAFLRASSPQQHDEIAANYLGDAPASGVMPLYAFAGHGDLHDLPPTLVVTCEYDELRSSGDVLAEQLSDAGVPTEHVVEAGALHGHLNHLALESSARTVERMAAFLVS